MNQQQLAIVNDQLSNNDTDNDQELVEFFVEQGISLEEAKWAVGHRMIFMTHPFARFEAPAAGERWPTLRKDRPN